MLPVLGGIFESQGSFGFERDQNSPDATKNWSKHLSGEFP